MLSHEWLTECASWGNKWGLGSFIRYNLKKKLDVFFRGQENWSFQFKPWLWLIKYELNTCDSEKKFHQNFHPQYLANERRSNVICCNWMNHYHKKFSFPWEVTRLLLKPGSWWLPKHCICLLGIMLTNRTVSPHCHPNISKSRLKDEIHCVIWKSKPRIWNAPSTYSNNIQMSEQLSLILNNSRFVFYFTKKQIGSASTYSLTSPSDHRFRFWLFYFPSTSTLENQ